VNPMATRPEPAHDAPQAWYRSRFGLCERSLNGGAAADVHAMRREALERFAAAGFPPADHEEWRFTNIDPIVRGRFVPVLRGELRPADAGAVARHFLPGVTSARLVFVDGHYHPGLSSPTHMPRGIRVGSLAAMLAAEPELLRPHLGLLAGGADDPFTALGTAFLQDGAVVLVPDRLALDLPVHILFVSTGAPDPFMTTPRNLVVLGKGARAAIVESYVHLARNVYFTNAVTEVTVGEDAVLEMDKVQLESESAFHVGSMLVRLEARSTFTANSVSLGGAIVRNNAAAVLGGGNAECTLNGLSLATGQQLVDNHTTIDHAHPDCASHELYKCILDGRARGVFNGKIFVRKDAQKTDAKQTNKTLLLSDDATIDTKPQLEIFADDVKCTHGATVGQLDETAVFYLRSRGIGLVAARDMLTNAFASDITNRIKIAPLRGQLDTLIHARLHEGRLSEGDAAA